MLIHSRKVILAFFSGSLTARKPFFSDQQKSVLIALFCGLLFFVLPNTTRANLYRWDLIDQKFDSIAAYCEEIEFLDYDRSLLDGPLTTLFNLAGSNKQLLARAYHWDAWRHFNSDLDRTTKAIDMALSLADSSSYPYDYMRFRLIEANTLRRKGDWINAYHIFKQTESFFKEIKDDFYLARTYVGLGLLFMELKNYELSLDYFYQTDHYFSKSCASNCQLKNKLNISNILNWLGKVDESIAMMIDLQSEPVIQKDKYFLLNVMISHIYFCDTIGKPFREKTLLMAKELENRFLIFKALVGMGDYYMTTENTDSTIYYYTEALKYQGQFTDAHDLLLVFKNLYTLYERVGDTPSALYYLKEFNNLTENVLDQEKVAELNRAESQAQIDQINLLLKEKDERIHQQRKINLTLILGSILVLSLVANIAWRIIKRERIKKRLQETEKKSLELQKQSLEMELDSTTRELTSNIMLLSEKNKNLQYLLGKVDQMINNKTMTPSEGNKLKKQISDSISLDDSWDTFKFHFEKVHPNFFSHLKANYPKLTPNDLRICAYIRIGLSNKEIAQILSVRPESIVTFRYRIRSKLHLRKGDSLEDFLQL